MMENHIIAKYIRATIRAIEKHGWTQHYALDRNGKCCLQGAIYIAVGGSPMEKGTIFPLITSIKSKFRAVNSSLNWTLKHEFESGLSLVSWNDQRDRKKEDVLALLRQTLKRLEGES